MPITLAERYGIRPGEEVRFEPAGDTIRVVPPAGVGVRQARDVEARLRLLDAATERQRVREAGRRRRAAARSGWTREELYHGGRPAR